MNTPAPSRSDQWLIIAICIFLFAYGLHGIFGGMFFLPSRRDPTPTVEGAFTLIPLLACWFIAASLLVRTHILLPQLQKNRTSIELVLLALGISFLLFAFYLSDCGQTSRAEMTSEPNISFKAA